MKKTLFFAAVLLWILQPLNAQNELYQKRYFTFKENTLPYRILFPENYDRTKTYPLVVFLHGAGERGNDNEKQLVHGSWLFTNEQNRQKYPAIVIFPQCPAIVTGKQIGRAHV